MLSAVRAHPPFAVAGPPPARDLEFAGLARDPLTRSIERSKMRWVYDGSRSRLLSESSMKISDPLVTIAGVGAGLLLAAMLVAGCNTSTEPTVQLNFPEGMKVPEPAPNPGPVPGTGVTSQGDPRQLLK